MTQDQISEDPKDVEQVRRIIEDTDIAMVTTSSATEPGRLVSRPLSTQTTEADGDILFLTRRDSDFVADITANPQLNVAYASKKAWVSVAGEGEVVDDRAQVQQLWSRGASMFMEGGPENPDNVVVRVKADTAAIWGGESYAGMAVKLLRSVAGRDKADDGGTKVVDLS